MGFLKFDVQGAIMEAVGNAFSNVAKTLDFDGDGQKDLEQQLIPMGNQLASGAQDIVDSVDVPALAANAMIVAADIQQTFSNGKALLKTIDMKKAQTGATKVSQSVSGFVGYCTRAIATQHQPKK